MKRLLVILMVLAVVTAIVATAASVGAEKTQTSPLQQILAFVPDTPEIRAAEVGFVDFEAMIASSRNAARPKNYQDWLAIVSANTPEANRFRAALQTVSMATSDLVTLMKYEPDAIVASVGIDPFSIQRALSFGPAPSTALVLEGAFDPVTIAKALEAKTFQKQPDLGVFSLWCGASGCESGAQVDVSARDKGNPFGGRLGRRQPIAANAAHVFSSASYPMVQSIAKASDSQQPSLAAAPAYLATANAFISTGTLTQVLFINADVTRYTIPPELMKKAVRSPNAQAAVDKFVDEARAAFVPIPAYSLVSLARAVHGNSDLGLVGLVYNTETDAQTAQTEILVRLAKYQSILDLRPLIDRVKERHGTVEPPQIYHDQPTGKYVLILTLSAPVDSGDATPERYQGYQEPGQLFDWLITSLWSHDLAWLAVEFSAPLE